MSPLLDYLYESDDDEAQQSSFVNPNNEYTKCVSIYYEHIILPSDTFQGICLQYKVIPTKLRQLNKFSGNSLSLAPKKLIIPKLLHALGSIRVQDRTTEEYKIHYIMSCFEFIDYKESKEYCEIHEWDTQKVVECISHDFDCNTCEGRGYSAGYLRKRDSFLKGRQKEEESKENHYNLRIQDMDFSVLQKRTDGALLLDLNRLKKIIMSKPLRNRDGAGDNMNASEFDIEMKDFSNLSQSSSGDIGAHEPLEVLRKQALCS